MFTVAIIGNTKLFEYTNNIEMNFLMYCYIIKSLMNN